MVDERQITTKPSLREWHSPPRLRSSAPLAHALAAAGVASSPQVPVLPHTSRLPFFPVPPLSFTFSLCLPLSLSLARSLAPRHRSLFMLLRLLPHSSSRPYVFYHSRASLLPPSLIDLSFPSSSSAVCRACSLHPLHPSLPPPFPALLMPWFPTSAHLRAATCVAAKSFH